MFSSTIEMLPENIKWVLPYLYPQGMRQQKLNFVTYICMYICTRVEKGFRNIQLYNYSIHKDELLESTAKFNEENICVCCENCENKQQGLYSLTVLLIVDILESV